MATKDNRVDFAKIDSLYKNLRILLHIQHFYKKNRVYQSYKTWIGAAKPEDRYVKFRDTAACLEEKIDWLAEDYAAQIINKLVQEDRFTYYAEVTKETEAKIRENLEKLIEADLEAETNQEKSVKFPYELRKAEYNKKTGVQNDPRAVEALKSKVKQSDILCAAEFLAYNVHKAEHNEDYTDKFNALNKWIVQPKSNLVSQQAKVSLNYMSPWLGEVDDNIKELLLKDNSLKGWQFLKTNLEYPQSKEMVYFKWCLEKCEDSQLEKLVDAFNNKKELTKFLENLSEKEVNVFFEKLSAEDSRKLMLIHYLAQNYVNAAEEKNTALKIIIKNLKDQRIGGFEEAIKRFVENIHIQIVNLVAVPNNPFFVNKGVNIRELRLGEEGDKVSNGDGFISQYEDRKREKITELFDRAFWNTIEELIGKKGERQNLTFSQAFVSNYENSNKVEITPEQREQIVAVLEQYTTKQFLTAVDKILSIQKGNNILKKAIEKFLVKDELTEEELKRLYILIRSDFKTFFEDHEYVLERKPLRAQVEYIMEHKKEEVIKLVKSKKYNLKDYYDFWKKTKETVDAPESKDLSQLKLNVAQTRCLIDNTVFCDDESANAKQQEKYRRMIENKVESWEQLRNAEVASTAGVTQTAMDVADNVYESSSSEINIAELVTTKIRNEIAQIYQGKENTLKDSQVKQLGAFFSFHVGKMLFGKELVRAAFFCSDETEIERLMNKLADEIGKDLINPTILKWAYTIFRYNEACGDESRRAYNVYRLKRIDEAYRKTTGEKHSVFSSDKYNKGSEIFKDLIKDHEKKSIIEKFWLGDNKEA